MPALLHRFICANIVVFLFLGLIPMIRNTFGMAAIGICSFGLSLYLAYHLPDQSYLSAAKAGVLLSIPILISCEIIATAAKSIEILRGSQLAEQLFIQERGGPIELFLFLLFGTLFLSNGGGEHLVESIANNSISMSSVEESIQGGYQLVLGKIFALLSLSVALELLSGTIQRVSRKGFLGVEISTLRVPLAIVLLITLFEEIS